jgi:hypothetical protein
MFHFPSTLPAPAHSVVSNPKASLVPNMDFEPHLTVSHLRTFIRISSFIAAICLASEACEEKSYGLGAEVYNMVGHLTSVHISFSSQSLIYITLPEGNYLPRTFCSLLSKAR